MKNTKDLLKGSKDVSRLIDLADYKIKFKKEHPDYFYLSGTLVFCGGQGSGKTLSAVDYLQRVFVEYPKAILCTNTEIKGLPEEIKIVPYKGIESLSDINNGELGVVYFIDEIQLEFNSLESKNIPIQAMIEFSQQRKQRKHIVGTAQVYARIAKPLREQLQDCVLCRNYFKCIQVNTLINSQNSREENGKLVTDKCKTYMWFHSPTLYNSYDTYAKMKRYRNEWTGANNRRFR